MTQDTRHKSLNAIFWKADDLLWGLRRDPKWCTFHAAAGEQGLFFDSINKSGRGYSALSFRIRKRAGDDFYDRFTVSSGQGRDPIEAVRDALTSAIAAGFVIEPEIANLLDESVTVQPVLSVGSSIDDEILALLG